VGETHIVLFVGARLGIGMARVGVVGGTTKCTTMI
jgi:hypothetical protein